MKTFIKSFIGYCALALGSGFLIYLVNPTIDTWYVIIGFLVIYLGLILVTEAAAESACKQLREDLMEKIEDLQTYATGL